MNRSILAGAITAALVYPTAAAALDTKISGHVNRMVRYADDGDRSDVQFVDNSASQSRFRFNTSGDIGGGNTAGIIYEAGLVSNASGNIPLKPDTDESTFDLSPNLRHAAVFMQGNFGRVTLGHTSEAADGIGYADLSGTALADEFASWEHGSAIQWRINGADSGLTLAGSQVAPDGGRRDLIRYDTPSLGGFGTIAVSMANNERWSVGAFLGGAAGGGEWQLNAGYLDIGGESAGTDSDALYTVSGSYLFSQGTNITLAYGEVDAGDDDNADGDRFYAKIGHKWGDNALSVSYGTGEVERLGGRDVDTDAFGFGYVHTINNGIELYTGYHFYQGEVERLDDPDDVHLFVAGTRVKFN